MSAIYQLDRCTLHVDERILRRGDEIVPLPPRAMDVLEVLVAHRGDVVSKAALMDSVWSDGAVEEANLTQAIYQLRRALRECDPAVTIEVVPRRGYRLMVPAPGGAVSAKHRPVGLGAIAGALVLLVAGGFWWRWEHVPANVPPSYALGYYYWTHAKSVADDRKAIAYFNRAVSEEPRSALGYTGLADTYLSLAVRSGGAPEMIRSVQAAFRNAREAVALDPSFADAHAAFGQANALFGDPAIADRELSRAVKLDPTLVEARTWYGEFLVGRGRANDAILQFRAALSNNNSWTEAGDDLAFLYYESGAYAQSEAYARQSLQQAPDDRGALFTLALAEGGSDRRAAEQSLRLLERGEQTDDVAVEGLLSFYESEDENSRDALSSLARAESGARKAGGVTDPSAIVSLAGALAAQGQSETALAWLARIDLPTRRRFLHDRRLDRLRHDPGFVWLQ